MTTSLTPIPYQNMVSILIATEYVTDIVSYLISTNIPFQISYTDDKEKDSQSTLQLNTSTAPAPKSIPPIPLPLEYIPELIRQAIIEGTILHTSKIIKDTRMSTVLFQGKFKKLYNTTLYQYYLNKRMEYAAKLLREGYKVEEVSKQIGYGEKSAIKFNKMFQKHFGNTPKKYQLNATKWVYHNQRFILLPCLHISSSLKAA